MKNYQKFKAYVQERIGKSSQQLKSHTIKFNSLINVDDMEKAKGEDVDIAGKLVFVSCWADSKEENIAL
ncbi:MAG: hypothetical protein NC313_08515 [Butyrivibrio sp.]|nr:hypothetical protein [Butyrivibrio sp.]